MERETRCSVCWLPAPEGAETCGNQSCRDAWRDLEEEIVVYPPSRVAEAQSNK